MQNSKEAIDRQTVVQDGNRNTTISSASSINHNYTHIERFISSPTSQTTYSGTNLGIDKPKYLSENEYCEIEDDFIYTVEHLDARPYDHLHQTPQSFKVRQIPQRRINIEMIPMIILSLITPTPPGK